MVAIAFGTGSGCLGTPETNDTDQGGVERGETETDTDETDGGGAGSSDAESEGDQDRTDANEPEFVRHPDGDAEITVRIEHTVGFGEPETYDITLELSHIELDRAGDTGGVRYDVGQTIELRKEPDEYPSLERTLVDRRKIPVTTYDYCRFYGEVSASSMSEDERVALSGGTHIERTVGTVFERGDHKELIVQLAVNEADRGYEVTDVGMMTLTW